MNKKEPLISVLMPNYNAQKYLEEAIESILNQTYSNFEFIIVDDCSTDNSWKIIQQYAKKDKRIKAYRNETNSGVTITLNNGLKHCNGKYIARMDSDDISDITRFEKQIIELNKYDIIGSNIIFIDENSKKTGKRIYSNDITKIIKIESPLAHPSVIFKKELIEKYGNYKSEFNSAEDYDLWLRFYSKGAKIKIINNFLLKYRLHDNQIKNIKTKKTIKTTLKVKLNARKNYKIKFGIKGWLRIFQEMLLLILPRFLILKLFYLIKGKK